MARVTFDMRDVIRKAKDLEKLLDKTVLETTQKLTLDCGARLMEASPVDTGLFRGAWEIQTPTRAYEAGTVSNNTVYGPALAKGHSPQADEGWIELAVMAAIKFGGGR